MKKWIAIMLLVAMSLSLLGSVAVAEEDPNKQVTLKWVIYADKKPESERVWAKFNEELAKRLPNTSVEFIAIDSTSYNEQSRLIVSAQEEYDIMWASNWKGGYMEKVQSGAFAPVKDLIDKVAPQLWDLVAPADFNKALVNGVLYGWENHQTTVNAYSANVWHGFAELAESKGLIDAEAFAKFTAYDVSPADAMRYWEPALALAKTTYPTRVPASVSDAIMNKNYEVLVGGSGFMALAGVRKNAESFTVENLLECDDFLGYLALASDWQDKGFFTDDIETFKNIPVSQWGKMGPLVNFGGNYRLDHAQNDADEAKLWGDYCKRYLLIPPYNASAQVSTCNFISANSKNKERAIKLLTLILEDADLYNLLCWGDESLYTFNEDGTFVANSNAYSMRDWVIGNTDNSFSTANNRDLIERNSKFMREADNSPLTGFMFNGDPVKNEIAAVTAILGTYSDSFHYGLYPDWEATYEKMMKQARDAGLETVIAECQKQVDDWAAANKK